jgi:hypothetical protein
MSTIVRCPRSVPNKIILTLGKGFPRVSVIVPVISNVWEKLEAVKMIMQKINFI